MALNKALFLRLVRIYSAHMNTTRSVIAATCERRPTLYSRGSVVERMLLELFHGVLNSVLEHFFIAGVIQSKGSSYVFGLAFHFFFGETLGISG